MQEGDSLVAAFEDLLHCNVELNTQDQDANGSMKDTKNANWHRISLVGFVRGELLSLVQRIAFETSDEEVDFTKQQILDAKNGIIPPRSSKGFKFFLSSSNKKPLLMKKKSNQLIMVQ